MIRGHHLFKETWTPRTEEIVQVRQEAGNPHDRNAVALLKADGTVVGHVPSFFLVGFSWTAKPSNVAWAIAMTAFCFVFRSSLLTHARVEAFDLKRMRLINQAL